MPTLLLDPTGERSVAERTQNERPSSLKGLTVGLLDISKLNEMTGEHHH